MKIAMEPSSFKKADIYRLIEESNLDTTFVFRIVKSGEWATYDFEKYKDRVLVYEDEIDFKRFDYQYDNMLIQLIHEVLNDHQTILFLDRGKFIKSCGFGVSNFTRYITNLVAEYYFFYKEVKPDIKYFKSTPHEIAPWVNAIVAEKLGITILVSAHAELSRAYLMKGFRKNREFCRISPQLTNKNIDQEMLVLDRLFNITQTKYEDAIPDYEKKRLDRNKGKIYNLPRDIKLWWKKPHLIYSKYICYKAYSKMSVYPEKNEKYIVFFMHYQPERTSHPEGFGFAQQMIAIHALRMAAPKEITIFVKEHLSTFTNSCDPYYRHPTFYEDINALPGVKLLKMDIDNFDIIDNALSVATLTGTVGEEALIRGIPAIYFGLNNLFTTIGVEHYETVERLNLFINQCIKGFNKEELRDSLYENIVKNMQFSVSGRNNYNSDNIDREEVRDRTLLVILKELCNNRIDIPQG